MGNANVISAICTIAAMSQQMTVYEGSQFALSYTTIVNGANCSWSVNFNDLNATLEVFNTTLPGQHQLETGFMCNLTTSGCQTPYQTFSGTPGTYYSQDFEELDPRTSLVTDVSNFTYLLVAPVPSQPLGLALINNSQSVQLNTSQYSIEYGSAMTGCVVSAGPSPYSATDLPATLSTSPAANRLPFYSYAIYNPTPGAQYNVYLPSLNVGPGATVDIYGVCYNAYGASYPRILFSQLTSAALPTARAPPGGSSSSTGTSGATTGGSSTGTPVPSNLYGDAAAAVILAAYTRPVFSLNFSTNPANAIGQTPLYAWAAADPSDSASVSPYHQGVVILNDGPNSFVDLNSATSANSAGAVLPVIGGTNTSWSFETVFKAPQAVNTTNGWPKIFFLGVNAGTDDIVLTFEGNVPTFTPFFLPLAFQVYNTVPSSNTNSAYNYAVRSFLKPNPNQWYHVVITVVPDLTAALPGAGNWYAWVNGVQVAWSGNVSRSAPGALYTSLQGASSILNAVPRTQSYLGKSDFSDGNAAVTIDAFRIYNYALPPTLITSLASAYGLLGQATTANTSLPVAASAEDAKVTAALASVAGNRAPIFAATFPTNPATLVGNPVNYQWSAMDSTDSTKTGVVTFNGTSSRLSYIDLTTTSGPQSCGLLLPVFGGAGSGTFGVNQGVSFEMVVKMNAVGNWNKLFDFSSSGGGDSLNDIFGVSWNAATGSLEVQAYDALNVSYTGNAQLSQLVFATPVVGTWYHIVLVLTNTDAALYTTGNWQVYVNGVNASYAAAYNMPLPVQRLYSFLGAGAWSDAPASMSMDAFRVYDYALSTATVVALASAYNLNANPGSQPGSAGTAEDTAAAAAVSLPPVLKLSFSQNPTTLPGISQLSYTWVANVSAQHTGVVQLTGSATSYIDLSTATGPNSAGVVMPQIGGMGAFPYGNAQQGWTFEVVVQFTGSGTGAGLWPKVMALGSALGQDDILLSYNGNDGKGFGAQLYSNATLFPASQYSFAEFLSPQAATWYHIVWCVQAAPAAGAASTDYSANAGVWSVYVNGVLLNWAGLVNNGGSASSPVLYPASINTPVQGAGYPISIARPLSYLGKSDYNDADLAVWIDAFRVYNYTLNATTVGKLAAIYGLNNASTGTGQWPIPANQPLPPLPESSVWSGVTAQAPVFNAVFAQNPAPYVGGTTSYTWLQSDPSDSTTVARSHQGLVVLNTSTSVIDVTQVTGPNSVGLALPIICTSTGTGAGCTIEVVAKLTLAEAWNKLINFGTGGYSDSLAITWFSDAATVIAQQYNKCGNQPTSATCAYANLNMLTPVVGAWYHITLVMTPVGATSNYNGTWTAYVNGVQTASQPLNVYPTPVYRQDSYIGGSDWTDAPISAIFDAVRVYNYPLAASEVQGMANKYGLYTPTGTGSGSSSVSAARPASSSSSSSSAAASSSTVAPATSASRASSSSSSSSPLPSSSSSPTGIILQPFVTSSSSSSSGAAGLNPTPAPAASSTAAGGGGSSSSSSLSGGAIAGIVIGSVVGVALLLVVLCLVFGVGRRGGKSASGEPTDQYAKKGGGYSRSEDNTSEASQMEGTDEQEVEMGSTH